MERLLDLFFPPPEAPPIHPLLELLVPGAKQALAETAKLIYHRGLYDGLIAGVLLTLLFVPSLRGRAPKG